MLVKTQAWATLSLWRQRLLNKNTLIFIFRTTNPTMLNRYHYFFLIVAFAFSGCKEEESPSPLTLEQVLVGTEALDLSQQENKGMPIDRSITLVFSRPLNQQTAHAAISLTADNQPVPFDIGFTSQGSSVVIYPVGVLGHNTTYTLHISDQLKAADGAGISPQSVSFTTKIGDLTVISLEVDGEKVGNTGRITEVPLSLDLTIHFSSPIQEESIQDAIRLSGPTPAPVQASLSTNKQVLHLSTAQPLDYLSKYQLTISEVLQGEDGQNFPEWSRTLYTTIDPTPKFPVVSDDELLTLVQRQTFRYFWDFAHENSGLARERNTSGDLVTTGGSGFGLMAIIVGVERGFISRQQAVERWAKIVDFLSQADRFHGVWPHWLNGNTGKTMPFSNKDNGGDLVETAFLIQGLLAVRAYLDPDTPAERTIMDKITKLWHEVEWDWYTRGGQDVLYWHWSPEFNWDMNLPIRGYNESLIVYVLAAASPTHPIEKSVYDNGWAAQGNMANGKTFYEYPLPLGSDYGGPLFFSHYSFLGLDPRNLSDQYANYWVQNRNHTLINRAHAIQNPLGYVGYSENSWGFTASDNHQGYSAHSPTNDLGVITPTAALSSMPYTPEESMAALKHFYYVMGDRLWGEYGFFDAFNVTESWYADSYLAIDQGPIIVMIENYRSGLLWDLFMTDPDLKTGLDKLGFSY